MEIKNRFIGQNSKFHFSRIFLFVGIPFLILSIYFTWESYQFTQNSIKTEGIVVDYHEGVINKKGRRRSTIAPVIEFQTPDSKKHLYYHDVYSRPPMYDIGEKVTVYYNPNDVEDAQLGFDWVQPSVFGFLGLIFTGFGVLFKKVF